MTSTLSLQDLRCAALGAASRAARTRALFRQGRVSQEVLDEDQTAEDFAWALFNAAEKNARDARKVILFPVGA